MLRKEVFLNTGDFSFYTDRTKWLFDTKLFCTDRHFSYEHPKFLLIFFDILNFVFRVAGVNTYEPKWISLTILCYYHVKRGGHVSTASSCLT